MSDVKKGIAKFAKSKTVAKMEAGERAEGLRDALRAGRGDVRAGARKLKMQKEGLPAALKGAKCPAGMKPRKGK